LFIGITGGADYMVVYSTIVGIWVWCIPHKSDEDIQLCST